MADDWEALSPLERALRRGEKFLRQASGEPDMPVLPSVAVLAARALQDGWPVPSRTLDTSEIDEAEAAVQAALDIEVEQQQVTLRSQLENLVAQRSSRMGELTQHLTEASESRRLLRQAEVDAVNDAVAAEADSRAQRRRRATETVDRLSAEYLTPLGAAVAPIGEVLRVEQPPSNGTRRPITAIGRRADGSRVYVPSASNFVFVGDDAATLPASRAALAKLLWSAPPALARVRFCDPINLGRSLGPLFTLLDSAAVAGSAPACTEAEIGEALEWARLRVRDVNSNALRGVHSHIDSFQEGAKRPEHYVYLCAFGVGSTWSNRQIDALLSLAQMGPSAGVSLIVTVDSRDAKAAGRLAERFSACASTLVFKDCALVGQVVHADAGSELIDLAALGSDSDDLVRESLSRFVDLASTDLSTGVSVEQLDGFGVECEAGPLSIPIGIGANSTVSFTVGDDPIHALVVGRSGSGKTTFLHTLIHSAASRYSPDALELWLVDLKEGVEFAQYADDDGPGLPQVRVVGCAADAEFGAHVLEALVAEGERRAELFHSAGVTHISAYRQATGAPLPAVLCVIDEFQQLLGDDAERKVSAAAWSALSWLAKDGRAFGLHLVLATQSMSGLGMFGGGSAGVWRQFALRVALKCDEGDARLVLGDNNKGAVGLVKGEAVLNAEGGVPSANVQAKIAMIDEPERRTIRSQIAARWQRREHQVVFKGRSLPPYEVHNIQPLGSVSLGRPLDLDPILWFEPLTGMPVGVFGPPEGTTAVLAVACLEARKAFPDRKLTIVGPNSGTTKALADLTGARLLPHTGVESLEVGSSDVVVLFGAQMWQPSEELLPHRRGDSGLVRLLRSDAVVFSSWTADSEVMRATGSSSSATFPIRIDAAGSLANRFRARISSSPPHHGFLVPVSFMPWAMPDLDAEMSTLGAAS